MNQQSVSIIIPVYNVAPYIVECLQSVESQTYRNLEVLIVDDCGTDDSITLAERFCTKCFADGSDIRYSILHHDKNQGLSAARNTGIQAAHGDYLFFLDSDDFIAPFCIEHLIQWVQEDPTIQMVVGGYNFFELGKLSLGCRTLRTGVYTDNLEEFVVHDKLYVQVWNKLILRSFVIANNLLFESGLYHEDNLWTFKAICSMSRVAVDDEITYFYRLIPTSIMHANSWLFHHKHYSRVYLKELNFLLNHPKRRSKKIYKYLTTQSYRCFFEPLWNNCPDVSYEFYHNYRIVDYWNFVDLIIMRVSLFDLLLSINRYLPEKYGYKYFRRLHMMFNKA